jgi:DNA-binding response OmpR family regulator
MLGLDALKEYSAWKATKASDPNTNFNKDMLVIGMSATASEEEQSFGFQNGMHFYSPKPVDLETLRATLGVKRKARSLEECVDIIVDKKAYTHR